MWPSWLYHYFRFELHLLFILVVAVTEISQVMTFQAFSYSDYAAQAFKKRIFLLTANRIHSIKSILTMSENAVIRT